MTESQEKQLLIEKPVYGGDFIARLRGTDGNGKKTVFVPMTLPGEAIAARVVEDKRNFTRAEVEQIDVASPQRVQPLCPHFGMCGGCHYQHANYPAQLDLKRQILHETLSRAGVAFPSEIALLSGDPWAYRNRIRLALSPDGHIGYRSRRSNEIIPIGQCPISAPNLIQTARTITDFQTHTSSPVYVDELELFTNHDQSEILVELFPKNTGSWTDSGAVQAWLESLRGTLPVKSSGIALVSKDSSSANLRAHAGLESLNYRAAGFEYRVNQGAFFQVNRWLLDRLVALVTDGLRGNAAWDLYAGVGLFALKLSERFQSVVAVESSPQSKTSLQHNVARRNVTPVSSTTLDYLRRNRLEREPRPDLIVLDPPRAGLGQETTALLNAIGAPHMIYASCDPTTLARDLRTLTLERYRIESVTLVDMFPQTFHLETVVRLYRT